MDTAVDRTFLDDKYSAYVLSKVIGHELSHGYSNDLYSRCWMNFSSNVVQTKAPQLVDLGIPAVNKSNELGVFVTPTTSTRRPADISHWLMPDNTFVEAAAVGMSAARSD